MEKKRKWVCLKSVLNLKSVKRKVLQVFLLQIMLLIPWGGNGSGAKSYDSFETSEGTGNL